MVEVWSIGVSNGAAGDEATIDVELSIEEVLRGPDVSQVLDLDQPFC